MSNASGELPAHVSSVFDLICLCLTLPAGITTFAVSMAASLVLLVPPGILVLRLAPRRRPVTHSDFFTCNMAATDLLKVSGGVAAVGGTLARAPDAVWAGSFGVTVMLHAQTAIHILTCLERYLAVVHPVAYLRLRGERGARIRNAVTGCSWLVSVTLAGLQAVESPADAAALYFFIVASSIGVVSFCNFSVLGVLLRPAPGEGGGARARADRSKLRAFHTITAILATLLLKFLSNVVSGVLNQTVRMSMSQTCALWLSDLLFSLPSSLVSPLLFLHRAGKLPGRTSKRRTEDPRQQDG